MAFFDYLLYVYTQPTGRSVCNKPLTTAVSYTEADGGWLAIYLGKGFAVFPFTEGQLAILAAQFLKRYSPESGAAADKVSEGFRQLTFAA